MRKASYKVDYHLICAIYFLDEAPSGEAIAELWTDLGALGGRSAEVSIMCRGDMRPTEIEDFSLGSVAISEALVAKGDEVISFAASVVRQGAQNAVLDSDVNFTFQRNGVSDGQPEPGRLDLSISGQVAENAGAPTLLSILKHFFIVGDAYSPICGLVDLARPDDAFAGMVFGTAWPRTAPLARWVEHMNWLYSGAAKADRLHGLYWGNYLGSKVLTRLGGRDRFLEICARNARNFDGTANAHCWRLANGLFISLCMDPLDCRPNSPIGLHPAAEFNLKWLIRELGLKGVLNHW